MKKQICILLASVMLFGLLCSCSSVNSNVPDETTFTATESTTYENTTTIENTSESTTEQITTTVSTAKTTQEQSKVSTTKRTTELKKQTTTEKTTAAATSDCENGNHSMNCGNIGKWFNSRSEVQSYVDSVKARYYNQYNNGEITWEEYISKAPTGYECWSCSHCGKWTGNFKYR